MEVKNLKKCFLNINKQTTNALVRNIQRNKVEKKTSKHISKIFDHRKHFPVSYHTLNMRKPHTVEDRAGAAWTFENKEFMLKLIKSMLCCYSLKFTITYILSRVYCSQSLRKNEDVILIHSVGTTHAFDVHAKFSSTALSVQDNVNTLAIFSQKKTIIYVLLIVVNSFLQTD